MASNPRDMFGTGNNNNSTNNRRFKSNTESTFDMFNINVRRANKAVDDVFGHARNSAIEFNKFYVKTTSQTMKTVANITVSTYSKVYSQLESMHKNYLSGLVDREASAASEVSKIWANARSISDENSGTNRSSRPSVSSTSNDATGALSAQDMSNFMRSLNTSLNNVTNNYGNHINRSIVNLGSTIGSSISGSVGSSVSSGVNNAANYIYRIFSSGISKFFDIWLSRFTQGVDKIYQMYEATYTNVSVVMNQNQEQYMSWQSQAMSSINQMELNNNVAISKVMETLSEVTKQGITGQRAQNKALSDTISRTIAPFVDTTTSAYTDLQFKLGDQFVNTMNGMGENISQQVGQQRVFSSSINQIITMLDPIMLNAKADYADKYLGEMMAGLEGVVEAGYMTQEQALQFAYDSSQGAADWYSAVTSDNLLLRTAAINAEDPTNVAEIAKEMFNAAGDLYQGIGGVREQSTVGAVTGANKYFSQVTDVGKVIEEYGKTTSEYVKSSEVTGKEMLKNFADDKYTTATAERNISVENASLGVAQFRQRYPDAYLILQNMLSTLTSISVSIIGGKVLSGLGRILGRGRSTTGSVPGSTTTGGWLTRLLGAKGATSGLSSMQAIGNGLVNTHRGTLTGSATTLGGAATIAGTAAGTAMAIYGANEAAKDFSVASDDTVSESQRNVHAASGTLNATGAVGGAVGAGALALFGASNPVGWVALAIGGISLGAAALVKHFNRTSEAAEQLNSSFDKERDSMKQEQETRQNQIDSLKDSIYSIEDEDEKRKALVDGGMVSEDEARQMSAVQIDSYMSEMSRLTEATNDAADKIFDKYQSEETEKRDKQMEDFESKLISQIDSMSTNEEKLNALQELANAGKVDQEMVDRFRKNQIEGKFDWGDWNGISVENVIKGGWTETGTNVWDSMSATEVNDWAKRFGIEMEELKSDEQIAQESKTKSEAEAFLKTWGVKYKNYKDGKESNITQQQIKQYEEYKKTLQDMGVDTSTYYAAGNPYIASDQLAYLHQGEAVLTKEENKEYRSVASSIPIVGNFLGGLFDNKLTSGSEEPDAKRNDIITAMNTGFNKLVDAILSIKANSNTNNNKTSIRIAEPVASSYEENIINLAPSMITRSK